MEFIRSLYQWAKVEYNGKIYEGKWWTQGVEPDAKFKNDWEIPWKPYVEK